MIRRPPTLTLFPYTPLFRSGSAARPHRIPRKVSPPLRFERRQASYRAVEGEKNEGTGIGQEDVPELQDRPAQAGGARDLHGSAPQATTGLNGRQRHFTEDARRLWLVSPGETFRTINTPRSPSPPVTVSV